MLGRSVTRDDVSCTVKKLAAADHVRWDVFVESCPQATFFHRSTWRNVIERAFGHPAHYLYAERSGAIVGILPLAEIRSRLFNHALVSTPFCVYGGIAARDAAAGRALRDAARDLAENLGVDYLELRNRDASGEGWPVKKLYVTFRKTLDADPDANLKAIPRKQRAMVRKGVNGGLHAELDTDPDRAYHVYAESVRNLGTPVFSRRYFRVLKESFGQDCELLTVTHEGAPVSAVMNFYFRDEVLPYYGGGTFGARRLKANDFMYWQVMKQAAERGVRTFDFGRSKIGTGAYDFKLHWGFEPQPLHYEYHLVKAASLPDLSPLNPKYRMFIKGWQKMPLTLSRAMGPWLARDLG
ncbi:MAG TPA: FemAB family XrtA/PEP-CTERM system-associated protein [Gammaproteobacteria bacterium]|nr:FemAB family XrtA/PEP-CTERM system-associated protein [Gammaproteobacteria bacterium]